jgi:DNA-binding SARP family transcriptional activator
VLELRVLGELEVVRDGAPVMLPPSRKTRALLAYLALTRRTHRRERLCEIFWDVPDDPRGALRWSLSKIRPLVDDPGCSRLVADRQTVELLTEALDLDFFDAQACAGAEAPATGELARAASSFRGPLLADLDLPLNTEFHTRLVGLREDARKLQLQILRALTERLAATPQEALPYVRELVRIDPYDEAGWALLISNLAAVGRGGEARQQYEAATRILREVGGGSGPLLRAWRTAQASATRPGRSRHDQDGACRGRADRSKGRDDFLERTARPAAPCVDRRAAFCQFEQRPRTAIFCRWDHRKSDDRSVADPRHARDLAQYRIHLSEQAGRYEADWPRARRALCARRRGPALGKPGPCHCPADRC